MCFLVLLLLDRPEARDFLQLLLGKQAAAEEAVTMTEERSALGVSFLGQHGPLKPKKDSSRTATLRHDIWARGLVY